MKKFISILMVLTLILGLSIVCGCNLDNKVNNEGNNEGNNVANNGNKEVIAAKGSLYSLKEAYENEWLMESDLQNIAYYFHVQTKQEDKISSDFTAQPLMPETLEDKIVAGVKKTYQEKIKIPESERELINLYAYYGTYNGCVAVGITDTYNCYDLLIYPEYEIGGVTFYKLATSDIRIWREDKN